MKHQIVMTVDEAMEIIGKHFGENASVVEIDLDMNRVHVDLGPFYINGEVVEEEKGD